MAGHRLEGIRRPKADKGVLEGPPPRIMSRQANGGGRPQCDDEERQPLGAGRVCESHHRGQNVLRIPLVPERIPAVENEKTLTRVSDKQEFTEILYRRPIFFWRQRRHPLEEAAELGGGGKAQIVRYFRDRLLG